MATADQYAAWIVQNQAKRGTPDFDTVAKAYEQAKLEDTKPVSSAGFSLKDLALSFGQGVGGGTQAITDIAGAGNVVSKGLSGLQEAAGEAMSPERQAEIRRRQEIKKKAEGNTWEEVKATLGGFGEAPLQTLAQGAGSMVPMIAGTLLVPQAAIPAAAARLTALGVSASTAAKVASTLPASTVGAMMGVGGQKGQDYETVKRELLERKIPEAEAERLAQKAAEYSLENAPRQLAGGAAGFLEGALGVESLIGRAGRKVPEVKGPSQKLPEPTVAQAIGRSTASEALPEALQSVVGTVGTNVALNQAGVPTDLTQGVLANALHDALVGGVLGAGASPLKLKEMRQEYVQDEFKGQQEYAKQQREEIAANKKKIDDELGMTQNPLGMLTPDDLGADLTKAVELHRASTGKPALTSFSLDDVVDALPGKDKAADAASLNAIIAAKTGYTNEVYTPTQVIEAAQAKNVETGTQGFDDFLSRTTGLSDPAQMSQPQLHAAVTALGKLPGFTSMQSLPEGLNATNYTPEQFTQAIDGLNAQMDALNKDELTFKETTKAIETATGLKGSAVNALVNDAVRSGDVVTDNKKVSVPSRTTPTGYGISEEIGAEQEQATSYEIRRGDEILDEYKTKEAADEEIKDLNKLTAERIKADNESIKAEEAKLDKAKKAVQELKLAGNRSTPEFQAAQDAYQQATDEAFPRIAEIKARQESYQTPLSVVPVGVKKVKPKSYVVRKGEGIQTVKQTREEAEQAIFADLADTDLQELAKKRSPALQKRVNAELQRRAAMPAKAAPATEAAPTTPEQQAKLDQFKKDLPAMLERFGLKDVGLKIVDAIEGGAEGSYQAKLIQIALSAEKPIQTLRHEAIHALKELGFFTPQQWAALERQARKEWVQKYLKDKPSPYKDKDGNFLSRYDAYKTPKIASRDGLTEEDLIEEAIADAFADWDSSKAPGGMLTALLNKMRNFFEALKSYLNGQGFQTYKDVFGKIEAGELKATAPAVSGEAKKNLPEGEEQRAFKLNVEREQRKMARSASLTEEENAAVMRDAEELGLSEDGVDKIVDTIIADKKRYPVTQGWADLKVIGITSKLDESGNPIAGKEIPKYAPISYAFNVPPGAAKAPNKVDQVWLGKVTDKFQKLIEDLYERAESGDVTAKNIIAHQTWYKNVAATLRQEYGAFGDTLADLLGATSPNTPVDTNWRFSIDVMRRFVRGDFDAEMSKFVKYIDSGKAASAYPTADKITQITGKLYGMNSTNAMLALADMWRSIKPNQAPKARNFALNLIGQSNMATIDVWAARMLRRAADMVKGASFPRIPPPAEQGVTGKWNADATKVTGAFGFGADVMQNVSDNLAKKGINIDPPDLQAIAWFAEKELWTKKNWTNKAGEGGSFEENIEGLPTERYIAGHSIQVGKTQPKSEDIKDVQKQITSLLSKDKSVIAFRAAETSGLYGGTVEKSFDTELVVEKGKFDPEPLVERLANISKEYDQFDIFISKVIGPKEENLNARPGVEIYFKTQQDMDKIIPILKRFTSRGQDGFTLAVDPRLNDGTSQYVGVRLQYVPEISMRWDEGLRQKLLIPGQLERILKGKAELLESITAEVSEMEGVAYASVAKYDTLVIGKENYDDYTHGRTAGKNHTTPDPIWFGESVRKHVERAITRLRGDTGQVSTGDLPSVDETQGERKLSLPLTTEAAKKSENLRGIISDETLYKVQEVLNTYTEKPKVDLSDEKIAKGEQLLSSYMRKAEKIKPRFEVDVKAIADAIGGTVRGTSLKSMGRSIDKLWTDTPNGMAGNPDGADILDLLRTTIVVDNESQIKPTLELLTKKFGRVNDEGVKELFRIKDRFTTPLNGYRDILTNVKLPNGTVAEIQVNVPTMITAKSSGHAIFAMSRVLPKGNPERIRLEELSKDLYEEAYLFSQKSKSPLIAGSARANVSNGTRKLGFVAQTVEPSLSSNIGSASKAQTVAPSGTLNISDSSKDTSIKESKKSLKTNFETAEEAENAAYRKAPPTTPEFKRFFGNSVAKEEGRPQVMYHASMEDFPAFRENRAIFVSPDPYFVEDFIQRRLNESGSLQYLSEGNLKNKTAKIYPVWVRAEKPFDYENPSHVRQVVNDVAADFANKEKGGRIQLATHLVSREELTDKLSNARWDYIEDGRIQQAIKKLGFDSFYTQEGGAKNLALYNSNQVKSVTGNTGEFGETKDMRFSLRQAPDTPEFKRFFANSKVVDADGEPLVVSHISKAKPTVFDRKYRTDLSSMGFHFGTKEQAQFRGTQYDFESRSPTIGDYYLSIQNPLEVSHMASYAPDHLADQMMDMDLITEEKYDSFRNKYRDEPDIGSALVKILQKAGYDGLVYSNEMEGKGNSYVPFESTQIKSATENIGSYDPANPDTRYSLRTLTPDSTQEEVISILPETPMFRGVRGANTSDPVGAQYFTSSDIFAKTYSSNGKVDEHRLTLQNPLVVPDSEWSQYANSPFNPIEDIKAKIKKGGHDGVVNVRKTPMGSMVTVLALDSKKAAKPNIRYSLNKVKDEVDSLPNGVAINASINRIAPGREQKGYIERIIDVFKPQSVDALRQQFLNRYNQLGVYDRELAKQMGGAALLADSSAESAALMSDNAAAIATMACGIEGKGGVPVYDNGFTTISNANGEKGVLEILMPLAKRGDPRIYQTYQFWAGSIRGSRLITETDKNGNVVPRDHTYTQDEIDYAKELLVKYPEFKQVQEDWIKYNNGLMKYAVSTGVLSPEKAAEFMKYSDYIPFYRQIDGETTVGPKLFQNISGVTPPKKLKGLKEGQEAPLADFLETIVRNTQSIIQSGMKNVAAQRAIDVARQLKMAGDPRQDVSYAPGVVTVLEKGKPVSYDVADQLFVDAVKSLNLPELPFLSFFAAPANLLRNLVTKDPGFMMANLMRDSLSAWVTSGAKMTPIASTIANFGRAIGGTDPAYIALRNAGVIGGYEFAAGVENSGTILGESLRRATGTQTGTEKALKPFTSLWRGLEKGTEASDAATRMAVYKATLEKTGNEAEAIYRAMEVLNFNRKGNLAIVRILTAAVPFLNARMQGLDVFYRAAFGKMASADAAAIQKSFFIRGATLMALTSMYWFLTHDDEEYLAQEQETRDNNWLFPSAGVRIPIPFEVGVLFKVVPERMLEYAFGSDTGKDMADSFKRNLINTFAFNPIPQTVLPFVEARTNYSFFTMRPIVGQGMENVAKEYQVAPNTSEAAKRLGGILGESPIIVDHIMKGYTGSLGMYAIDLIDAVLFSNGDSPKPAKRFEQMPVIKRFALDKEAKGTVTAYYELKNSVDEVVRTINLMERTGNIDELSKYGEENIHLYGMRSYISSIEKDMKKMREAAIQIRASDMPPEEKRDALLSITQAQNEMTANIRYIKKTISQ